MKKIAKIFNFDSDNELLTYFKDNLKLKGITQWNYFVNWEKVYENVVPFEKELNLLNILIGKDNIQEALSNLILQYPKVVNAIPLLIAIRFKNKKEQKINILINPVTYQYYNFDLSIETPDQQDAENIATFFLNIGLGELVRDIKN